MIGPPDGWTGEPARGGVLPDWMIERHIVIDPFVPEAMDKNVISYGITSYGYDARVGYKFKVFSNVHSAVVDPKKMDPRSFVDFDLTPTFAHDFVVMPVVGVQCSRCGAFPGTPSERLNQCPVRKPDHILIPPNSFALAETLERFEIPRDVIALCGGKSTYARCGIIIPVTPLEPSWRGRVTVEISNTTPLPAKVYAGEGIMQVVFFQGVAPPKWSYADKKGRYQDQTGLTLPFVKGG